MASHWNASGEVDGYTGKAMGTFLLPVMGLLIFLLMAFLPKIDPLKLNYKKFQREYDSFILVMAIFLTYIYSLTIAHNLGYSFNMSQAILPIMAILFYYISILMKKSKRNWFVGIRTPWTISSDNVWDKTHKLGAKLFKVFALSFILPIFFPGSMMYIVGILILGIIGLFAYSYLEYKKETK